MPSDDPTSAEILAAITSLDERLGRRLDVVDLELRALRAQITLLAADFTSALADHVERGHPDA